MRISNALAMAALCFFGLCSTGIAKTDAEISERCVECHDEEDLTDMSRRAHAVRTDARAPNCVDCHGPSSNHVETPEDADERPKPDHVFREGGGLDPDQRSAVCLRCHDRDARRTFWAGSAHPTADVACTSCHSVHTNHDRVLVKAEQTEVCYACHKAQRMELSRPSHHPVPEGRMLCGDCHNVHGSTGPALVSRDSTNDTCYTCHAEKRGPFVHEHEPVVEDCASCHNPHGSTIGAMLVSRPPMLCQQCHTPHVAGEVGALGGQDGVFTPAGPDQGPQINAATGGKNVVTLWQGRSCVNCHTQVHGSNNPAATNPTPQFLLR